MFPRGSQERRYARLRLARVQIVALAAGVLVSLYAARASEADAPFGRQSLLLHGFTSVQGRTLARKVREDWDHGYRPSVTSVADDDVDSVLINWDYPQSRMVLKVWVEPGKGYMIRKLRTYY